MMNDAQNRALWIALFRQLIKSLEDGAMLPDSIQLYTHGVSLKHFLDIVDNHGPLEIKGIDRAQVTGAYAQIDIGKALELQGHWAYFCKTLDPSGVHALEEHNRLCLQPFEPDAAPESEGEPQAEGQPSDIGWRDETTGLISGPIRP